MLTKNRERILATIAFLICLVPFINLLIKLQTSSILLAFNELDFSPFTAPRIVLALIFLKEIIKPQTIARFRKKDVLFTLLALMAYGLIVFNIEVSGGQFFSDNRFEATFPYSLFFDIAIIPLFASIYFSLIPAKQIALALGAYASLGFITGATLMALGESAFIIRDYIAEVATLILFFRWIKESQIWKNFVGYLLLFFILLLTGSTFFQKMGVEDPGKIEIYKREFEVCYAMIEVDKLECFRKLGGKYQDERLGEFIGEEASRNAYWSGIGSYKD